MQTAEVLRQIDERIRILIFSSCVGFGGHAHTVELLKSELQRSVTKMLCVWEGEGCVCVYVCVCVCVCVSVFLRVCVFEKRRQAYLQMHRNEDENTWT